MIGIISWVTYGTLNPLGFSINTWLAAMLSESIYGIMGGLVRKALSSYEITSPTHERINTYVFFGAVGLLLTLTYDVITNIVFGYSFDLPLLFAIVSGFVPFGLTHVMSNAVFFGLGCVPAINAISSLTGGKRNGVSRE